MTTMKTIRLFTVAALLPCAGCVHSYQKDINTRLQTQFRTPTNHQPINGYEFSAILPPVGTLFCTDGATSWPIMANIGCRFGALPQYVVDALSEAQKAALLKAMIAQDAGGGVVLSDDVTHHVKFDLAMPLVGNIANINANADIQKHTTVSITAGQTFRRTVNWDSIKQARIDNQITQLLIDHIQKKDFILAASDIIMLDYKATVTIDNKISTQAKAALADQFKILAKDTSLTVNTDSTNTGTYTVSANKDVPIVVAALYVLPPPGLETLEGNARVDVLTWPKANVANPDRRGFRAR